MSSPEIEKPVFCIGAKWEAYHIPPDFDIATFSRYVRRLWYVSTIQIIKGEVSVSVCVCGLRPVLSTSPFFVPALHTSIIYNRYLSTKKECISFYVLITLQSGERMYFIM